MENNYNTIYTLGLELTNNDYDILNKRFTIATNLYNRVIREILSRKKAKEKDPRFKKAYKLPKGKERNEILRELDIDYKLRKYDIGCYTYRYSKNQGWDKHLPNNTANKIGNQAYNAYKSIIFGKGKYLNLNNTVNSLGSHKDDSIYIRNGILKWKGLNIPVKYRNTEYEEEILKNRIKYHTVIRYKYKGKWKYDVQLTLEGKPPVRKNDKEIPGSVGIDIGTSTIALSSLNETVLEELAPNIDKKENELRVLYRKLDRQRRANNPDNYNSDGTIRRGKKTWKKSKRQIITENKIREIKRLQAEKRKLSHKNLANKIINMGDRFIVEQMSFKGLQSRTKETTINKKTGKFNSKKRFGKTILHKAPASLISYIKYKAEYKDKIFIQADTKSIKASQLNHITGEYNKVGLNTRTKEIDDKKVQRDLYSAFLLQHVNSDGKTVDLNSCNRNFETFLINQEKTLKELLEKDENQLTSMGLKDFK